MGARQDASTLQTLTLSGKRHHELTGLRVVGVAQGKSDKLHTHHWPKSPAVIMAPLRQGAMASAEWTPTNAVPAIASRRRSWRESAAGPPAFHLDRGLQQALPPLVDGTFDDPDDEAEASVLLLPGTFHVKTQQGFPLAWTGFPEGVGVLGTGNPFWLLISNNRQLSASGEPSGA